MRKLAAMSGVVQGTVFALVEPSITVGRADESMICLDDTQVSRHHALLVLEGDEYRVRDLNAANGTYVNGQRVTEARLAPGDHLQIGAVELVYEKERAKGRPAGPVAPTLRSGLPQRQEQKQPEPVVVVGSSVATLRSLPHSEPVPARDGKTSRKVWTGFWIGVGLADCIFVAWFAHHVLEKRRHEKPLPVVAVAPMPVKPQSHRYADPQGRFVCEVPEGWRVEEEPGEARSKVAFVSGTEEIRVIAQAAATAELAEVDRTATVQAFNETIERARGGGASGRLLDSSWRDVAGMKALQVELEVGAPRYFWMRQVKFRQGGLDHTVALYVGSPAQREKLVKAFEDFLRSYRSVHQEARR